MDSLKRRRVMKLAGGAVAFWVCGYYFKDILAMHFGTFTALLAWVEYE